MELSAHLVSHLSAKGYEVVDHGPKDYDAQDDYPSFCINAALAVVADQEAGTTPSESSSAAPATASRSPPTRSRASAQRWPGTSPPRSWPANTTTPTSWPSAAASTVSRRPPTHRGLPAGAVQQRRAPRPPDRQDRHLRAHRRGRRLVPEGHSVHRLARQFGGRLRRGAARGLQPAGAVRARRGAAGRPHPDRLRGPRQAPVPGLRARPAAPRPSGPLRRLELRRRCHVPRRLQHRRAAQGGGAGGLRRRRRRCEPPTAATRARPPRRRRPRPAGRHPWLGRPPRGHHLRTPHRGRSRGRAGTAGPGPAAEPSRRPGRLHRHASWQGRTPLAALLMDQKVIAGVGNVYRAELLFRQGLDPWLPGRSLDADRAAALGRHRRHDVRRRPRRQDHHHAAALLERAVPRRPGLPAPEEPTSSTGGRAGLPGLRDAVALTDLGARKLYWCPDCQRHVARTTRQIAEGTKKPLRGGAFFCPFIFPGGDDGNRTRVISLED